MIPRLLHVRGFLIPITLIDILAVILLGLPVCLLHGAHDLVHVFFLNFSPRCEQFEITNQIDAANAAVLSRKLLQMANGAIYNADKEVREIYRQKLLRLEDLIEQANGQNVLVAYWYGHDHDWIKEHLTDKGYRPRDIKTDADITDWNAGKINIGLISPASAGHGLNIQNGGHILIWFSMIWSLEM